VTKVKTCHVSQRIQFSPGVFNEDFFYSSARFIYVNDHDTTMKPRVTADGGPGSKLPETLVPQHSSLPQSNVSSLSITTEHPTASLSNINPFSVSTK
jgi:hypothetical protein